MRRYPWGKCPHSLSGRSLKKRENLVSPRFWFLFYSRPKDFPPPPFRVHIEPPGSLCLSFHSSIPAVTSRSVISAQSVIEVTGIAAAPSFKKPPPFLRESVLLDVRGGCLKQCAFHGNFPFLLSVIRGPFTRLQPRAYFTPRPRLYLFLSLLPHSGSPSPR